MDHLFEQAFSPDNPGYRPDVREAPHGDGRVDFEKRYAHVNPNKYTHGHDLCVYYANQFDRASQLAFELGLPMPGDDSTLRFLEYPPGVGGEAHTDFSLFTRLCYQSRPGLEVEDAPQLTEPLLHFGEIAEIINPAYRANLHWVHASPETRRSVVFFTIPDHGYKLPSGITVGEWIAERKARSRIMVKG